MTKLRLATLLAATLSSYWLASTMYAPRHAAAQERPAERKQDSPTKPASPSNPSTKPATSDKPPATSAKPATSDNQPAAAPSADVRRLLDQLGDDQYLAREQATEKLLKLGSQAVTVLETGRRHPDREVRYRCERILLQIMQQDFELKLTAFLRDAGTGKRSDLPGWEGYKSSYGDTRETRLLFVEMQKAEPELLSALERNAEGAITMLTTRVQEFQRSLQGQANEIPAGSMASLLWVAVKARAESNLATGQQLYSLCHQPSFRNAITTGVHKDLMRKMLGEWIVRGDDNLAYMGIMLAMQYELKEGIGPAEKIMKNQASQPYIRQYAILMLARLGGPEHLPLIEACLTDERSIGTWQIQNVNINTQVRDVALASLVLVTKQDPKEYGFERLQTNNQQLISPITAGFESADGRNNAIKKWREYREKMPAAVPDAKPNDGNKK